MNNYKKHHKSLVGAILLASGIMLSACGGSSDSSSSNQNSNGAISNAAITIDNTGTVPVFGGSSTKSVVYVHNNTTQTISGISFRCARHGAHLGGASPLLAPSMGIMSLCKGVYREVESEGSKWRSLVVTNRNHIVGYYIG